KEALPPIGHARAVTSLALRPDGHALVSGGEDGALCLWDVKAARVARRFGRHQEAIRAVCFSPDGGRVASGEALDVVRVWSPVTGRERFSSPRGDRLPNRPPRPREGVRALTFSPDGKELLCAGAALEDTTRGLTILDAATGKVRREEAAGGLSP